VFNKNKGNIGKGTAGSIPAPGTHEVLLKSGAL